MSISDISGVSRGREKRKVFEEWMKGDHVIVHINTAAEGVIVPPSLMQHATAALKMSYLFQGETATSDLEITSWLKFSGSYFKCEVPWTAVWGIVSDSGQEKIWQSDIPREALMSMARAKLKALGGRVFKRPGEEQEVVKPESPEAAPAVAAEEDDNSTAPEELSPAPATTERKRNFQVIRGSLD